MWVVYFYENVEMVVYSPFLGLVVVSLLEQAVVRI
jgi:hypothetical protein